MTFKDLGLSPHILKAVSDKGYEKPSPIQADAIPAVLKGSDIMAAAQTGTGKTAGFTLPILERLINKPKVESNNARVLILAPTRELAAQIGESVVTYSKYLSIKSTIVFGGVKINPQMMKLRRGVDILIATPGRLLDLYQQNAVKFNEIEVLVLDEADRMLDMGFIHDIKKIISYLPKKRQNLLFSATFSKEIRSLAKGLVNNPVEISIAPKVTTAETVEQFVYPVDKTRKSNLLIHLIKEHNWQQLLVFCKTKHGSNHLTKKLVASGIQAAAIHGNKSQGARTKALADFKENIIQVLVATDIAARGLDINQLPQVINYDLPHVPEDYVHRIGRTGRAGNAGEAISFVSFDQLKELTGVERLIKKNIERKVVEGFEPNQKLPEINLNARQSHSKKPKKAKTDHRAGNRQSQTGSKNNRTDNRPRRSRSTTKK